MAAGDGAQLPATVAASRSVEKALDEASASGALNLSNRKLKEFPRSARNYDLSDITHADLSRNRLCELPEELCHFISLETLSLYHNGMRTLSPSLLNLQALSYLNLSRNLLSSLPPAVFQLPLLRVLIVSNNRLSSLPASIFSLVHLRQLDVSCNELQHLPAELGQLESLRDLNLRRNQLCSLPEEISELPLVRLDVSCNRISHVPLCYRHLRHLQSILLENNPLQMPPAQICSKGKYHIFKYLNMEACKRSQEDLEAHLRPTGFSSCLSEQELFPGQFGGLDSGFNSVDSGSKRWSGNESTDDFSERSIRMAELNREQRDLEEEEEEVEGSPLQSNTVKARAEQLQRCSGTEEQVRMDPLTSPAAAQLSQQEEIDPQQQKEKPAQTRDSTSSSQLSHSVDVSSSLSSQSSSPVSPASSPSLEERRRPGTLLIWQERERQQQRDRSSLLKQPSKTGSHVSSAADAGSGWCGGSPDNGSSLPGPRRRCCVSPDLANSASPSLLQRSNSRTDVPPSSPKTSPPPAQVQKPNSFLFRASSRSNVKTTDPKFVTDLIETGLTMDEEFIQVSPLAVPSTRVTVSRVPPFILNEVLEQEPRRFGSSFSLAESGKSESHSTLRSPREERTDVSQLRKTLESRLKITLSEDLGEALSNGTILCQLVNQIRPRLVSIIHVPSPAVPKLSPAKCRLNLENFLTACRKLGVTEEHLSPHLSPQLTMEDEWLSRLAQTVQVLLELVDYKSESAAAGLV